MPVILDNVTLTPFAQNIFPYMYRSPLHGYNTEGVIHYTLDEVTGQNLQNMVYFCFV